MGFASVNGIVVPAEEARVSVLDNGFAFGDSVYEVLRTVATDYCSGFPPFEVIAETTIRLALSRYDAAISETPVVLDIKIEGSDDGVLQVSEGDFAAEKLVVSINGVSIDRLEDVPAALAAPREGFHVIELEGFEKPVVLDAAEADRLHPQILRTFRIEKDKRL